MEAGYLGIIRFYTIFGIAIHTVNSLKVSLIFQPARSGVKTRKARAYENRPLNDF